VGAAEAGAPDGLAPDAADPPAAAPVVWASLGPAKTPQIMAAITVAEAAPA